MTWHIKFQHICDIHWTTSVKSGDKSEHNCIEVDVPNSVVYLLRTPVFKWYVVWCVSKNGHHKDTCLEEIGLRVQTKTTILS